MEHTSPTPAQQPEDELQALLAQSEQERRTAETLAGVVATYRTFLTERGEVLTAPVISEQELLEQAQLSVEATLLARADDVVTEQERQALLRLIQQEQLQRQDEAERREWVADMYLRNIASTALQMNIGRDAGLVTDEAVNRSKQRWHTTVVEHGLSQHWFDLVTEQYPGVGLTREEAEQAVAVKKQEKEQEAQRELQTAVEELELLLISHGEAITNSTRAALTALASIAIQRQQRPKTSAGVEQARDMLREKGFTSPIWTALVEAIFDTPRIDS